MRILKLQKKDLSPFLEVISREAQLWAPVTKGDKFVFDQVKDFSRIAMNATRTIIPPKKIMVPSFFNMFHFSEKGYQEDFSHITDRILFGIHPCDIHGLLILDKLFSQAYLDPYYLEARKKTLILGLSCWPDEFCLCKSTHTDIIEEGYDLFFTDLESHFLVWIGSSRGDDLVRLSPGFFDDKLTDKDIQTYIKWQEERDEAFQIEINFTRMPNLMELKDKAFFWEEAGAACLACGSCSMVCPTCNCYNVVDKQFLGNRPGQRLRYWDSCTLPEYSEVAGGENFREHKSQRLRLWYTHKLQAYVSKYGKPSCVGCGRCLVTCPVQIHIKSVTDALEGHPVEVFWKKFAGEVSK
ncbi:MAG TPA: 4Fe-4S dicluster domain-containing protein [Candidatus Desulfaltia sp.]|nr:4Fe-4S dicluster domain-containing protein [Candidatus Desulfaltia sp.]